MKRSTLILFLIAAALGAFVYFYEVKRGKPRDEAAETGRPTFTFKREDVGTIALKRSGQTVVIENLDGKWVIKQPVETPADQSALDSIVGDLMGARVERHITASAEETKSYGLSEPAVIVEIKLKNGEQHSVRLGSKDFSGLSVYGQIDGAKEIALLSSASLLTDADKSLNDLRDRAVLGITQYEISSLDLKNESGRVMLAKKESDWLIKSPIEAAGDESEVSSLLSEISSAKVAEFVSETADDLASYGLEKPSITLTAQLQGGGERVLTIGSKAQDLYFAKNSAKPQIFKVESGLYDKLSTKLFSLRDKHVLKLNKDDLTRVQVKNPNLTLVAEKDKDSKWIVKEPAEKKDKEAQSWKIFDPLETNKATAIFDTPPASISAKLRKPAVEVRLTGKDGKTTTLVISAADGDDAYVRVEGRREVYKVSKQMANGLSFKVTEVIL